MYYWPTGFSYDKCAWLCESGYSGQNCIAQTSTPLTCDETIYSTADSGKFGGISLKTSGGDADQKEQEVTGFNQWGTDPECDVVLGVIRYLNHGVVAAPVKICCGRNNWKSIDSYVNSVDVAVGQQKLLCASGYTANDTGTDCVQINPDACATQNMTFCANFPRESYDSAIHTLEETEEGCVKYFCSEPGKAFPASGDTSCVECDEGVRGGASRNNGVCMHCEMGQYFDTKTSSCRTAKAYSKTDMQYGDGKRGSIRTCLDIRAQSPYRMPYNCQPLWKKFHRGLQPPDGKSHQDCFGPHLKPLSTINDCRHILTFMT